MEGANPDQPTARDSQDVRSRCLADGYLESDLAGLTEEDMAALLDYEGGSTPEGATARLKHMTIWRPDTPVGEIVEYLNRPHGLEDDDSVDPFEADDEGATT